MNTINILKKLLTISCLAILLSFQAPTKGHADPLTLTAVSLGLLITAGIVIVGQTSGLYEIGPDYKNIDKSTSVPSVANISFGDLEIALNLFNQLSSSGLAKLLAEPDHMAAIHNANGIDFSPRGPGRQLLSQPTTRAPITDFGAVAPSLPTPSLADLKNIQYAQTVNQTLADVKTNACNASKDYNNEILMLFAQALSKTTLWWAPDATKDAICLNASVLLNGSNPSLEFQECSLKTDLVEAPLGFPHELGFCSEALATKSSLNMLKIIHNLCLGQSPCFENSIIDKKLNTCDAIIAGSCLGVASSNLPLASTSLEQSFMSQLVTTLTNLSRILFRIPPG